MTKVVGLLAHPRAVSIIVGVLALLLAHTTRVNYTFEELPGRDLCVLALLTTGVIGAGTTFVRPTRISRAAIGVLLMVCAAVRIAGFSARTLEGTDGVWRFMGSTNVIWVWALVFYLGFLIWARRDTVVQVRGARSEE